MLVLHSIRLQRSGALYSDITVDGSGVLTISTDAYIYGSTTLGNADTDSTTIRGAVSLTDNSATYPLNFGADCSVYRYGANSLYTADSFSVIGNLGVGTVATYPLDVLATTGYRAINLTYNRSAAAADCYGATLYLNYTGEGTPTNLNTLYVATTLNCTATVSALVGSSIYAQLGASAGGTVAAMIGLSVGFVRNGAATVTNAYGVLVNAPSGSGSTISALWSFAAGTNAGVALIQDGLYVGTSSKVTNYLKLRVYSAATFTSSQYYLAYLNVAWTPGSAVSASAVQYGIQSDVTLSGSSDVSASGVGLVAVRGRTIHENTHASGLAFMYGSYFEAIKNSTGPSSLAAGVTSVVRNQNATGAISDGRAFYAASPTATGTIDVLSGLYIAQQKISGVTLGWGIYQYSSSDLNYFAGNTGMLTESPQGLLHLNGRLHFSEIDSNPVGSDLTSTTYSYPTDRVAIYMKSDKLVVAYVSGSSTVHYVYLPLDGASSTWTYTTTAP